MPNTTLVKNVDNLVNLRGGGKKVGLRKMVLQINLWKINKFTKFLYIFVK